jgi:hypothetical protein
MLSIAAASVGPAVRSLWGIGVIAVFVHSLVDDPLSARRPPDSFLGVVESARQSQMSKQSQKI